MYLPWWLDEEYPELFWNRIHWLLGFVLQYVAAIIIKANIHVRRSYPHLRHETALNSSEFVSFNVWRDKKNDAPGPRKFVLNAQLFETFRSDEEDDYQDDIWFDVFFKNIETPKSFNFRFFTRKIGAFLFTEGG